MAIGLGFVSICLSEKDCSPAGDVTVKIIQGIADHDVRIGRIRRTALRNLTNTRRIMAFMSVSGLSVYRFATHLIPLATHEVTDQWAWWEDEQLQPVLQRIGKIIREEGFRVSTHPPQLCVLNSPDASVFQWVKKYTDYHVRLFNAMGLDEKTKIILHVGRRVKGGPKEGIMQAIRNIEGLPQSVRSRLAVENDDRTYSAKQTLQLCQQAGVPMVFDLHHHICRNDGENFVDLLPDIFATWKDRPAKIHLSSPRDEKKVRAHADYVNSAMVATFLKEATKLGNFDVMVEAKQKDLAALKLRDDFPDIFGKP